MLYFINDAILVAITIINISFRPVQSVHFLFGTVIKENVSTFRRVNSFQSGKIDTLNVMAQKAKNSALNETEGAVT